MKKQAIIDALLQGGFKDKGEWLDTGLTVYQRGNKAVMVNDYVVRILDNGATVGNYLHESIADLYVSEDNLVWGVTSWYSTKLRKRKGGAV